MVLPVLALVAGAFSRFGCWQCFRMEAQWEVPEYHLDLSSVNVVLLYLRECVLECPSAVRALVILKRYYRYRCVWVSQYCIIIKVYILPLGNCIISCLAA